MAPGENPGLSYFYKKTSCMKPSLTLIFLAFANLLPAQMPAPHELLEKSVQYHDPDGNWGKGLLELSFEETRPNGSIRYTNVKINIQEEYFAMDQKTEDEQVIRVIEKGESGINSMAIPPYPKKMVNGCALLASVLLLCATITPIFGACR